MKIKIVKYKLNNNSSYCYECGRDEHFLVFSATDWEEINENKYIELNTAIDNANAIPYNKNKYHYVLFTECSISEVLKSAEEFLNYEKKTREEWERKEELKKEQREKHKMDNSKNKMIINFNGKFVQGCVNKEDGSGFLEVKGPYICRGSEYFEDSGHHNSRVQDIKKMARRFTNCYKELKKLKLDKI